VFEKTRFRFKVMEAGPVHHHEFKGERFAKQTYKVIDGTTFENEYIHFFAETDPDFLDAGDVISACLQDQSRLVDIVVEKGRNSLAPQQVPVIPQESSLEFAVKNNLELCPEDLRELAQRLFKLESAFHQHIENS
jgi:hypothetical protein